MAGCPSCGRENADDARFCSGCGTALATAEPAREQRKVVTILFCDLVGSTALGESSDPEALRGRMRRYFEDLRTIIERHGGTVEKFVGDAVMAVFGIPLAYEDDALRAVRTASEMRAAVVEHGLEARIGVNTGEVVVGGESETFVTGDAVNVAARLEQAASAGETLIGAETRLLVRDAVRVEPVEPLMLKGKSEPVEAFRLLEVLPDADALARHLETPLVGRERERQRLWRDYEDAVADRTCRLFTLLGPAGIGKSRLIADFLERVRDSADVLRARCPHYGEGITYWPLVEILVAIGVDPEAVIGTSPPETQLTFRRLLEARAATRPQVVVVDDLQWAEPVFVDLIEHVADLSRDAPIFLVCSARTELLDARPAWGGGKLNATSLLLEPLGTEECSELMDRLVANAPLNTELRERITLASAGNPLFVEEMLAMVRDHGGDGEIAVPPTIHALLQARIDSLDGDVRVVMERGSVEGEIFHRGAVAELTPDPVRTEVGSHLATLVRKELIRSTAPTFPEDEGFRFRHLLIRDAAYESLPKATRAVLHERFADWLSGHELVERDEIMGYHLEQAYQYRLELDRADPDLEALSGRAAHHLAEAGEAAVARGDYGAARTLLRRAMKLFPTGDERGLALAPDLVFALWEFGEVDAALGVLDQARSASDACVGAMAEILELTIDLMNKGEVRADERAARRDTARAVLEGVSHDQGLALYWWSVALDAWLRCRAAETAAACQRSITHSRRAGAGAMSNDLQTWMRSALVHGPTPVADAIEHLEAELLAIAEGNLVGKAGLSASLSSLRAMRGEFEQARELRRRSKQTYRDAGMTLTAASAALGEAWVEQHAGDLGSGERVLRSALDELELLGDRVFHATVATTLARCLCAQGRYDEVHGLCARARASTAPEDLVNFVSIDSLEALLLARSENHADAEAQARHAVELAEATDFWAMRGDAHLDLAEVLVRAGRLDEARGVAAKGLEFYESKGDETGAARAREHLEELGVALP